MYTSAYVIKTGAVLLSVQAMNVTSRHSGSCTADKRAFELMC